ncbi:hypothetical protein PYCC9005_001573 [Savitreella phatthalungensis]
MVIVGGSGRSGSPGLASDARVSSPSEERSERRRAPTLYRVGVRLSPGELDASHRDGTILVSLVNGWDDVPTGPLPAAFERVGQVFLVHVPLILLCSLLEGNTEVAVRGFIEAGLRLRRRRVKGIKPVGVLVPA